MFKNLTVLLFILVSSVVSSSAQNNWEYLEISGVRTCYLSNTFWNRNIICRNYNFLTNDVNIEGDASLKWLTNSGWELVSSSQTTDNPILMLFKRSFKPGKSLKEIEFLKAQFEKNKSIVSITKLIDLDKVEFERKLKEFNVSEEQRIRTILQQIESLPLKIISLVSKTEKFEYPNIGVEIVLDGTPILLKDGRNYRSSEVEKYFQDSSKKIIESLQLRANTQPLRGNAREISDGIFKNTKNRRFRKFLRWRDSQNFRCYKNG